MEMSADEEIYVDAPIENSIVNADIWTAAPFRAFAVQFTH